VRARWYTAGTAGKQHMDMWKDGKACMIIGAYQGLWLSWRGVERPDWTRKAKRGFSASEKNLEGGF